MTDVALASRANPNTGSAVPAVLCGILARMSLYAWLALLVVLPNILLIGVSLLTSKNGVTNFDLTLQNFARAWESSGVWVLLWRTVATALLATAIATLIAYPMAYYAARILERGRFLSVMLVVIPLWISLLMRVFAWRVILGESGVLNAFLLRMGLISEPSSALLYNSFAVFLTFVYVSIPFIFVAAYSAIDRIPPSLTEAANDCGASGLRAFFTVVWPLSRPGTSVGVALAFLMAVGDYITPSMVGGLNGTMLGMVIASQFGIVGNWPYGAALALMLLVTVAVVLAIMFRTARVPGILTGETGGMLSVPAGARSAGNILFRWLAFALFCLPYLFLYAPLAIIAIFSFNDATVQVFPLSGMTFRWYQEILSNTALLAALNRSLYVGLLVLLISIAAGTGFAILLAYARLSFGKLSEQLLTLPVAIPGVVLGITLVLAFQLLRIPTGIPRVVLGHCTFVMPVIMLTVLSRLRRLDPALVEASTDLGASYAKTVWHVVLPLVRGSIIGGALLGFTLSVDEVVVSLFLTGTQPTLPVWVWNQMRFGFTPSVNAIFVCIGIGSIMLTLIARRFLDAKGT
ncbi:ABC transporter permease subunit [uncultured Paracoccus sp.]|uniref:ABC transporter permease subunit n=1 Tax=uncultured Paracoccus sp. TaxID=189685 RepID=UPI002616D3B8|nr:ABC transporter permease subunit [uncultured Paracoccus sp.]